MPTALANIKLRIYDKSYIENLKRLTDSSYR